VPDLQPGPRRSKLGAAIAPAPNDDSNLAASRTIALGSRLRGQSGSAVGTWDDRAERDVGPGPGPFRRSPAIVPVLASAMRRHLALRFSTRPPKRRDGVGGRIQRK